jgi:hypothetical protein
MFRRACREHVPAHLECTVEFRPACVIGERLVHLFPRFHQHVVAILALALMQR